MDCHFVDGRNRRRVCSTAPTEVPPIPQNERVSKLGSIEITAQLVEIPEGAIFQRDLYNYATVLKYHIVRVHRGDAVAGSTIYVGHYNPFLPAPKPPTSE